MAGHNKWSKIKRQKAATDSKRSKAWAMISREIMVATRDGGGDPSMNARLALAVQKAKRENMPKESVARAIRRGTGEIDGQNYEKYTYEGYAAGGVAVLVKALTDNTNRTVADLRNLFSKAGGCLGKAGSVAYLFDLKGVLQVEAAEALEIFDLAVEAGAEDVEEDEGMLMIITAPEAFESVHQRLLSAGIAIAETRMVQLPRSSMDPGDANIERVLRLLDQLQDHPDVQAVYSNLAAS